ncbi:hypothetical protein ASE13_10035 [Sphingomonas sp. Root241]|nr:hypothetical protein ASE13_10035 [Sphingomonas sp. Root241]
MMAVITRAVRQVAQRILAHRPMEVPRARKRERALPRQRPERPQDRDRLGRQRYEMVPAGRFLTVEVALHSRDALPDPLCRFDRPSRLDLTQRCHHEWRAELRDRQFADSGKYVPVS